MRKIASSLVTPKGMLWHLSCLYNIYPECVSITPTYLPAEYPGIYVIPYIVTYTAIQISRTKAHTHPTCIAHCLGADTSCVQVHLHV